MVKNKEVNTAPVSNTSSSKLVIECDKNFAESYVELEGSQKKEVIKRLDRVSEDANYGKSRNLEKGVIEIKFDSGIRIYGGLRKVDGKDTFYATVLGGKGDPAQQNRDIQKATEIYTSRIEQDTKNAKMKVSPNGNSVGFAEVSSLNKKQFKELMARRNPRSA